MRDRTGGCPMMHDRNDTMGAFLMGAIVGAAVALFLAPAAGEETRRRLGETARRLGGEVGDRFGEVKEGVTQRVGDVKAAVNAGRDAYQSARRTEPSPTSNAI